MFAEVAFPLRLKKVLTYRVPEAEQCRVGVRVLCPLGNRKEVAFVVNLKEENEDFSGKIKDIIDILDSEPVISEEMLSFTKWAADYYFTGWGEMIKASLPAAVHKKYISTVSYLREPEFNTCKQHEDVLRFIRDKGRVSFKRISDGLSVKNLNQVINELESDGSVEVRHCVQKGAGPKYMLAYSLNPVPANEDPVMKSEQQKKVYAFLKEKSRPVLAQELKDTVPSPHSVLKAMVKKGIVVSKHTQIRRNPFWNKELDPPSELSLTVEQDIIVSELTEKLVSERKFHPVLISGITGSGKTEVYIRILLKTLELGMSAIYLVPEISLTPQTVSRLSAYMYKDVAILHSGLSDGERADEWNRMKSGRARLAVGTRSAIFAPLKNIGVIIVDEEHDSSYKQNENPCYNARDLALVRGRMENSLVILGSATPSIESFTNAKRGKYKLYRLTSRVSERQLPSVEIIDLKTEFRETSAKSPFSRRLESELFKTIERGEQAIVLLNRRGYSSFVICRNCGYVPECRNCSVSMTYHKSLDRLKCHYCGYMKKAGKTCPECKEEMILMEGWGTQQIEEYIVNTYPDIRVIRMDRDSVNLKNAYYELLEEFSSGKAQVLVGTQMIAKGHDFPNVTLVGVVLADTGLGFPDFRSAENTFQLVNQVSGRSGRGDKPGKVVVQTFYPEHYSITSACEGSYEDFYNLETGYRESLKYPPFSHLAALTVRDGSREKALQKTYSLVKFLRSSSDGNVRVIGPSEALVHRKKNIYYFMVLIKASGRVFLKQRLDSLSEHFKDIDSVKIDIDPLNIC